MNHILVLSGNSCYSIGDNDTGALGRTSRFPVHYKEFDLVSLKKVTKVFATAYNSFFKTSDELIYGCGLNNYG